MSITLPEQVVWQLCLQPVRQKQGALAERDRDAVRAQKDARAGKVFSNRKEADRLPSFPLPIFLLKERVMFYH